MVGLAFSRMQLDKDGGLLEAAVISESGLLLMISNGCVEILGQKRNYWLPIETGFFRVF